MRIKEISVSGLFGIFGHVIPLNMDERITIIHGPNGFGKTIILRMLNGFFNSRYSVFYSIPFSNFKVKFDNDSSLEITKNIENQEKIDTNNNLIFKFEKPNSKPIFFKKKRISSPRELQASVSILENIIPELDQISSRNWRYLPTKEILSLAEVLERFEDVLPPEIIKSSEEPEWLDNLKSDINIRLIESQRLLNVFPRRSTRLNYGIPSTVSTVSAYSDELAKLMQDRFAEYGATSQSLDRTFPVRVVKQQPSPDITDEKLRHQLNELEETRSRLIEVGLLNKDEGSDFQIQTQTIDDSTKNILSVYVEDVEKKLSVFDEIASKINLLSRIINKKFEYSYKKMNFSKEKGFLFTKCYNSDSLSDEKKYLSPTDLSSGEQHELVLLYELLFKVEPNSLVLIDEPELSLHVGWQIQFLKDLQEITELADLYFLMATHSPDIIQDRWDLTVELKGPDK